MQNMAVFQLNLYITKQGDMDMIYYDHFSKQMTSYRTKVHKAGRPQKWIENWEFSNIKYDSVSSNQFQLEVFSRFI